jgi:MFS family permease
MLYSMQAFRRLIRIDCLTSSRSPDAQFLKPPNHSVSLEFRQVRGSPWLQRFIAVSCTGSSALARTVYYSNATPIAKDASLSTTPFSKPANQWPILPLLAWGTAAMFFFYAWVLRVAPSVMVSELMRDFAVGGAVLGNLSAFYFYGYSTMQIPVGLLMDRFGPRRLLTISALACTAGCLLFAASGEVFSASLSRLVIGAGAAFGLVGAMTIAGQWFPAHRFALLSGLAMMMGMVGGVFGQAPARLSVEAFGWRETMMAFSAGGLVLAVAAWSFVRDKPVAGDVQQQSIWHSLGVVVRNWQVWLNAVAGIGTTAPLLGFAGLWGVPYFETRYEIDQASAAGMTSMVLIGLAIGSPFFGWLSDRVQRRRLPLAFGLLTCLVSFAALVYLPEVPISIATVLALVCGFGAASQITCFAAARESSPGALSGTTLGITNGLVTSAGAVFQPLIGALLDVGWAGETQGGARVYDLAAYQFAFIAVTIGSAIGLLSALATRETYCRPLSESEPTTVPK